MQEPHELATADMLRRSSVYSFLIALIATRASANLIVIGSAEAEGD
jgi:hypothetical protein